MDTPDPAGERPNPTATATAAATPTVALDERALTYDELRGRKAQLVAADLILALRDGRALVRANAALGLAVLGHAGPDLVPFLRDSHPAAAGAVAEALVHLDLAQRANLGAIAAALDGARKQVADRVVTLFANLIGKADPELLDVLDTSDAIAADAVVEAAARVGVQGLQLLYAATRDRRPRVRIHAVRGVGLLADLEPVTAFAVMRGLAFEDEVSDVRAAARAAMVAFIVRTQGEAAARRRAGAPTPAVVPALLVRALSPDELRAAAAIAPLEELALALIDVRTEARLNAVRILALQGPAAAGGAPGLVGATRDVDATVRAESVRALGALGAAGVVAAPALVRALGDSDPTVIAAADAVLAALGPAAAPALIDGLEIGNEAHGARVAGLLGRLPDGARLLREALAIISVDVRVNAALGLATLGKTAAGAALPALVTATAGGNARVRAAVARALEVLAPPPDRSLPAIAIDGFEERSLTEAELVKHKDALVAAGAAGLARRLADGRPVVRANAALGLAVLGHTGADLVPFLRDGHPQAARAAAASIAQLGGAQRAHLGAIAAALDGARPEVVDLVLTMLAALVGQADGELTSVLDTSDLVAASAVVDAAGRVGVRGLHLLQAATRDVRPRVRINAVRGVGLLADLEPVSAFAAMRACAFEDEVSDVRAAARAAIEATIVRTQGEEAARHRASEPPPPAVPALQQRALTADELRAAAAVAPQDELRLALIDARPEVRLNAVRVLALQGPAAAASAGALAVATRDADPTIRGESVRALGGLGAAAAAVAPALVRALGDGAPAVSAAAEAALAALGPAAAAALVDGLDVASEAHGARVAALVGRLGDGAARLRAALAATSVDARVNAALGLAALGPAGAGDALPALIAATAGGNARVRAAVARALEVIAPPPDRSLPAIAIDGFDDRALTEADLGKRKDALTAAGFAGLAPRLADARPVVRANAALALGLLGDAAGVSAALAVGLRDDVADVRLAAARGLARLGAGAIAAAAHDLVRALGGSDGPLAAQVASMLSAHADPAIDAALVRGLDTEDPGQATQVGALVCARPTAVDLLCAAFARPGAQANVARGFVALGADGLGRGRALLERARTDSSPRVRELARTTLLAIDGVPVGPPVPAIPGFEDGFLERTVLAKAPPVDLAVLSYFLADGRAAVRANAATALGTLGPAAASAALTLTPLLRDDDVRVRIAAARAIDQLGDDAVIAAAPYLVGALGGDARVAEACHAALATRGAKVEAALLAGLETSDETHGLRVADLICALANARELLFAAFDGEAQNVQINAAYGIAKLGAKRAGAAGRQRLLDGLPGPLTRRRDAMIKALAMLGIDPATR